jgi:hypothetical protein
VKVGWGGDCGGERFGTTRERWEVISEYQENKEALCALIN